MKRLTPTEPKRELSLDELVEPTVVEEKAVEALPKSKVYSSIKKLSSFKQLKSNYKMQTQKDIFVSDVRALLSHLDVKEHKLDVELLIEVLNACEDFFIYGNKEERNQCKVDAINELMIDYFHDEQILNKFVT